PGRGPDLLSVDHPVIAIPNRAGPQRRKVRSRLRLAVAHAMHGLAAQNFRQVFLLLLCRAEHHERVGLDRRPDARGFAPFHGLDESDLLQRSPRLTAELSRPAQTNPPGAADVAGKFGIELALSERLRVEGSFPGPRPVLRKPE